MRRFLLFLLLVCISGLLSVSVLARQPCPDGRCEIAGGFYLALPPPGWDGASNLPVLMHFHGFRERVEDIAIREDIRGVMARTGQMLVLPQGDGLTWSHPGSPSQGRDEFAFIEKVLADLKARYPVNEHRLWASGFSQGASMVWNIACHRGAFFAAYLPISGAFWRPEPEDCPSGARALRHIHGLSDRTVPLTGRPIRGGAFHQGDVYRALGLMKRANACKPEQSRTVRLDALTCEVAGGCAGGTVLEFCLHAGGHDFDPDWLESGWVFINALPAKGK